MGYMHIRNLYADQTVLMFKDVFVLEKVHGTSAHIAFERGQPLKFHRGGVSRPAFLELFSEPDLTLAFQALGHERVTVYGEAFGGKLHRGSHQYGDALRFVAFDVKHNDRWLDVPGAQAICAMLALEFVYWRCLPCTLPNLDAARDEPSRYGVVPDAWSEGVVIRPVMELVDHRGNRIIAKHKRMNARETKTPRLVGQQPEVIAQAECVADEYVTSMRLTHVLDKVLAGRAPEMSDTPAVMAAMIEDVLREGEGEVVDSKAVRKAISTAAARLFKARVQRVPSDA